MFMFVAFGTLFRGQPYCLNKSEAYVSDKLKFFMEELKYTPCYLMDRTSLWTLSLEKRIKLRNEVLKILKEMELVKDTQSLATIVTYFKSKFLDFVWSYEISSRNNNSLQLIKLRFHRSMFRFSIFLQSHGYRYSILSSTIDEAIANRKPHLLLMDYLMDSLQFSKQDAISISTKSKVTRLKSTINSDLVVNIFKTYGLNLSQIRQIVSSVPKILTCKPNKTLEPKIRVFQELGLSGSDLFSFLRKNPQILWSDLHTKIMPCLQLLRELLGSDEKAIQVMNRSRWLYFSNSCMERLSKNVSLLQDFGLLNERIAVFVINNPNMLTVDPSLLESRLSYVQEKLGISRESPAFIYALNAVLWLTDSEIEKKRQIFRSFGWSESDIGLLFRCQPNCLSRSEANIRDKLNFYMKDLGYTPLYLMSCTSFFTLSLDKRVKPRNTMLKILKEKKLVSNDKPSLITIANYTESKFLEFLRGFEDDVPSLCKTYLDSVKSSNGISIQKPINNKVWSSLEVAGLQFQHRMFRFTTFFRSHGLFRYSTLSSSIDEAIANRKPNLLLVDYLIDSLQFSKKDAISISTKAKPHLLLVDYLMDSLQFSKQDAISISTKSKVTRLKSTINSDLVVNIFKTYGLDLSQIRQIVSSVPKILTCKPNKTLEPKIRVFHELGLSGSDLVSFIQNSPNIMWSGLDTKIMPCLQLLRQVLGSDEIVIQVMNNRTRRLFFTNNFMERLSTNVLLLQNFGLLNERIVMFVLNNPNKLIVDPTLLESKLSYVEEKLGISRESPIFIHALTAVLWYTDSEIERKMQNFRSFGWSDSDIALLFRGQPYCLTMSEANMRNKLKFYMKDLGYTPSYLISRHAFFTLSLDKRVIPRNAMLKILKEKKLVSNDKPSLITIANYTESKFLEFLRGFEDDVPCLRKTYLDSVKSVS
ncbi:hypothetical protein OSB04_025984 [Centaurea solstitialis]|uniref:Uncharacterized protein n=1 Tax=Centaurea solstitialis TaxID=347529 RepID=A0AA38W293_9ASTR|nr:hypothetical protein OSB04_025984 [Centaurea solstitialis]